MLSLSEQARKHVHGRTSYRKTVVCVPTTAAFSFLDSALTQGGLTGRRERMSVQHPQAMDVLGVQTSLGDE